MKNLAAAARLVRAVKNWPAYYAAQYLPGRKPAGDFTFELRNGLRFRVRSGTMDKAVFREVWIREMYAPPGFSLDGARTVIDIGAHIGAFTLFAAHHAAPDARIFSFEPDSANFAALQDHLKANNIRNVQAFNAAVASKDGEATFYRSEGNTGGHSLVAGSAGAATKVPTLALAPLLEREGITNVDYLKIDCEGSEYDIFFNLPEPWFTRIDNIGMEVHAVDEARSFRTMKAFLEGRGFDVSLRNETPTVAMIYARRRRQRSGT